MAFNGHQRASFLPQNRVKIGLKRNLDRIQYFALTCFVASSGHCPYVHLGGLGACHFLYFYTLLTWLTLSYKASLQVSHGKKKKENYIKEKKNVQTDIVYGKNVEF